MGRTSPVRVPFKFLPANDDTAALLVEDLRELQTRRTMQLENSQAAVKKLEGELKVVRKTAKRCETLSNHSEGFYDEINKLAKCKTLVEATPLFVDQTNDIIRDARDIVMSDIYLDRIKKFAPAGNNPVYSEVTRHCARCAAEFG